MRISLLIAALIGAVIIASPSQASHKDNAVKLTGKTLAVEQVDAGKPGPSLGDLQVITEDVYRDGKRVGTSDIQCTIVRVQLPKFATQCFNTTSLPEGQITAQGVVTSDQIEQAPFAQAVTGGTGAYKGVRGELTVDEVGDKPAEFTFALSR